MLHLIFFLFCLALSIEDVSDLPYDDQLDQPVPTSQPENFQMSKKNESDSLMPLFVVLGTIGFLFLVSIISYNLAKYEISNLMTYFQQTLNSFLEKSLHLEKVNFMQYGAHEFEVFCKTNKPGIYGCIIHVTMGLRIDIIHRIKYIFTKKVDKISFEFLLQPTKRFSAMIHISKEIPFFATDFKLSKQDIACGYSSFSDVQGYDKNLITSISNFIDKYPDLIEIIEMSDANRFKTKDKFGYVTRVEFNVTDFQKEINFSTLRFGFELAEAFTKIKIPEQVTKENKIKREKLVERAKIQMEKLRKFQEAQRIFRETGEFPDLPEFNRPNQQNKNEQSKENNNENKESSKSDNNDDVQIDSSGNAHEKAD